MWSFTDNTGAPPTTFFGPFNVRCRGFMFLGCYSSVSQLESNTLIRVHQSEPSQKVQLPTGGVIFADGIPLATGEWFRLPDSVDQWWFSVENNIDGANPITYNFLPIYDDCFFAGSTTVPEDFLPSASQAPFNAAVNDTCQVVSSKPATLAAYYIFNSDTVPNYFHFFDRSSALTVGTGTRVLSLGLPAGAAANLALSLRFKSGIVVAATTTRTGNAPPVADLDANVIFN